MKKLAVIAFAALVAFSACSKVESEPRPAGKVTFAVGSYAPATKAVSLEESVDGITAFTSKGFLHGQGVATVQDFFGSASNNYTETISYAWDDADSDSTKDAGEVSWLPSHDYYWPKGTSSYVNFVSWYDKNGTPDNVASVSETAISWTFDGTNRALAADDNIMIADEAWGYKDSNATEYTSASLVASGVPTLFHHLLSRVRVVVKLSKDSDTGVSWTASASNFVLGNVYTTGSLALTNAEPASTPGTVAWEGSWATSGTQGSVAGVSAQTTLTTAGVEMLPERSMIPQSATAAYISFTYVVRTVYDANNYIEETVNTGNIRLNSFTTPVTNWAMNKIITYTVTINPEMNQILIDPTVVDWADPVSSTLNIE